MFNINIITQLLSFFALAVIVNQLNLKTLIFILAILLIMIIINKSYQFLRALKRFRWLFLVMLLIFAFNTPGEHLLNWPFAMSPTYEGLISGLTQTTRITAMLAAISLILASNTRQQLISGFYFTFLPLKYLGLEVERFAARLWLTLHYVETQREEKSHQDFFSRLNEMTNLKSNLSNDDVAIVFKAPQFSLADYLTITLLLIFLIAKAFL
jgi:energy-coupling factor transporter transmembrane protein EcfT